MSFNFRESCRKDRYCCSDIKVSSLYLFYRHSFGHCSQVWASLHGLAIPFKLRLCLNILWIMSTQTLNGVCDSFFPSTWKLRNFSPEDVFSDSFIISTFSKVDLSPCITGEESLLSSFLYWPFYFFFSSEPSIIMAFCLFRLMFCLNKWNELFMRS